MGPPLDASRKPTECDASTANGMSMADDNRYDSIAPVIHTVGRAAEPSRPSEDASARDPLAELARLLGQSDPFADFGRSHSRQGQQGAHDAPATAPDDWQGAPAPEPQFAAGDAQRGWGQGASHASSHAASRDYTHSPAPQPEGRRSYSRSYDELHLGADQQIQHYDNRMDDGQHDAQAAEYHYEDDVPLDPHDDAMYDDAPRARRGGGLATALALISCAVLGIAGAYAYRSYYGNPSSTQPTTANNSTPTKIVPAGAGDPQSVNVAQDRSANPDKEQIVSKQEEPVALKDVGTQAAPPVVLPAPVAPGQGASTSTEPKKIRTAVIRPDASNVSGMPVSSQPAAAPRPATAPAAPKAATASAASNGGPISLEPQPSEPAAVPAARTRTAAAPPAPARAAPETTESEASGFVVQLSSQKSEAEAQSSFRSLQAKFPNELSGLQPIIRRADLGSKGVFYRTLVGPFASAQEARQFCAKYKAAGGQCLVPNN
jgi:hypothetical protein